MCRYFAVSDFIQKAIERSSEVATRTTAKAKLQLGRAREKWDEKQQRIVEKSKRTGVSWIQKAMQSVKELAAELAEESDDEVNKASDEKKKEVSTVETEKLEKQEEEPREMEKTKLGELEAGDLIALEALEDGVRRFELNECEVDAMEVKVGDEREMMMMMM